MDLKSLTYVLFCLIVILAYYLLGKLPKGQRNVLLIANCIFIVSVTNIPVLIIICALTAFVFGLGIQIEKVIANGDKAKAKRLMWISVVVVVGLLCYFKFFKASYTLLQNALSNQGITLGALIVPVGISYYTLSLTGYIIDIYHKKIKAERNFWDFLVFVTYFPSIVEGPINLYKSMSRQFKEHHAFNPENIERGFMRAIWGYFKKVVIADRIGILVMGVLGDGMAKGFVLFWAMVLYSFQIYTDFSGGIDVVIGVSEALGIELHENFKAPLISRSVTEFWQKWHMTLGEFMEKYIYYPIVLDRKVMKFSKKIKSNYLQKVFSATLASIVVFVVVGIWHGTGWNYVVYGCYQALFVSSAVLFGPLYKKTKERLHIDDSCMSYRLFQIFRTFILLTLGRYFIKARDLEQAFQLFRRTFTRWNVGALFDGTFLNYGLDFKNQLVMYLSILLLIVIDVVHYRGVKIREEIRKQDMLFQVVLCVLAICSILIFGIYGQEFSSASFIYQGF